MTSKVPALSIEETNFLRIANLLIRHSPKSVRILFNREFHPNYLKSVLLQNWPKLDNLRKKLVITQTQWNLLFPSGRYPSSNDFDLTLMVCLLRNLTELTIQDQLPQPSDMSEGAAVSIIKFYRNQIAHSESGIMSDAEFSTTFKQVSKAIETICPSMKADCIHVLNTDLDNSFHDIYVEFVKKEKEIEELKKEQRQLSGQVKMLNWEKQNIESMHCKEIAVWEKKLEKFYVTDCATKLFKRVKDNQCTTITGVPGAGKSSLAYHVALRIQETEGYTLLPFRTLSDVSKLLNPNIKQLFIFDDIFGKHSLNDNILKCLESEIERIKILLENPVTKVIVTCRSYIYDFVSDILCSLSFSHFNLHSDDLNLSLVERRKIGKLYLTDDVLGQLNDELIMMHNCFPVLCVMFKEQKMENVDFFENLDQFLKNEIESFKSKRSITIIAFALLVISNNSIEKNGLQIGTNKYGSIIEDLFEEIDTRNFPTKMSIMLILQNLTNMFLRETDTSFCTRNKKMFDIISHAVGQYIIRCILRHAQAAFISCRMQLESLNERHDVLTIMIPQNLESMYFDRLLIDINEGCNWEVFANIQMKYKKYRCLLMSHIDMSTVEFSSSIIDLSTPLHVAAAYGFYDICEYIVTNDTDLIGSLDKNKTSPLHVACMNGYYEIVKLFLNNGAKIEQTDNKGYTPLLYSCYNRHIKVSEVLLEKHANVYKCDINSWCPIHIAGSDGNTDLIKLLVYYMANVNQAINSGMTPLSLACYSNHISAVICLLASNANVNKCDNKGWSALNIACRLGFKKIAKVLINNRADVNYENNNGQTPLYNACEANDKDLVLLLLEKGASVNKRNKKEESPLHSACKKGNADIVNILCKFDALINQCNNSGCTALHVACFNGHHGIAELLIQKGAAVNEADKTGETQLIKACRSMNNQIAKLLLENDSSVNSSNAVGQTSLHFAAEMNNADLIKLLIEYGANVNVHMNNGVTPIWLACQCGHLEVLTMLLCEKADVNKCEENGWSLLHIASFCDHQEIVAHLCKYDVKLLNTCTKSRSPLHIACEQGNIDMVNLLCNFSASVNLCDDEGYSPLHSASANDHKDVAELLIQKNAEVNKGGKNGQTPLLTACSKNCYEIVKLLLESGAIVNIPEKIDRTSLPLATCNDNTDMNNFRRGSRRDLGESFLNEGNLLNKTRQIDSEDVWTPLRISCKNGNEEIVRLLLKSGASLNRCDENGYTPLHLACSNGHSNVAEILITQGAAIDDKNKDGQTPLYIACKNRWNAVATLLLEYDADVNKSDTIGQTSLHLAACYGDTDLIQVLVEYGAHVNCSTNTGITPINAACQSDNLEAVKMLLNYKADVNKCDTNGCSILLIASYYNYKDLVAYLCEHSAAVVNATNNYGDSPLYTAVHKGNKDIVKILLNRRATSFHY